MEGASFVTHGRGGGGDLPAPKGCQGRRAQVMTTVVSRIFEFFAPVAVVPAFATKGCSQANPYEVCDLQETEHACQW